MNANFFEIAGEHSGLAGRRFELELEQAHRALALLKNAIGQDEVLELLSNNLEDGDAFWREAVAKAGGALVPAIVEFRIKALSASQFSEWFKRALSVPETMISANPEHYRILWNVSPSEDPEGFGNISVTEALGGVLTKFDIRWGGPELAYLAPDPEFGSRVFGSLRLEDGTEIGRLMHQFRDYEDGMIARLCILLPKGVSEQVVAHHREHLVVEWANWFEAAIAEANS